MRIKTQNDNGITILRKLIKGIFSLLEKRRLLKLSALLFLLIIFMAVLSFYSIYYGAKLHKNHYIQGYEQIFHHVVETNLEIPLNYFLYLPRRNSDDQADSCVSFDSDFLNQADLTPPGEPG